MILVRQVFQIKYGQMDEVLEALLPAIERGQAAAGISRILTDISGQNFTLVSETKAESLDAYWEALQASFEDPEMAEEMNRVLQYIESGRKEFYTIEYDGGARRCLDPGRGVYTADPTPWDIGGCRMTWPAVPAEAVLRDCCSQGELDLACQAADWAG